MACNAPLISHMPGPLGIWERYLHYISLSPSSISFMWFSLYTSSTVTSAVLYENTLATSSVISSKKTYTSMKKQKWNDERSENILALKAGFTQHNKFPGMATIWNRMFFSTLISSAYFWWLKWLINFTNTRIRSVWNIVASFVPTMRRLITNDNMLLNNFFFPINTLQHWKKVAYCYYLPDANYIGGKKSK